MHNCIGIATGWYRKITLLLMGCSVLCCSGMAAQEAVTAPAVAPSPKVEAIVSMREAGPVASSLGHKKSYDFTLKDSQWMDTGVTLAAGEVASFSTTGKFTLSDLRVAGPDGVPRGFKDLLRNFPLNSAKTGALIGRVSDMGASVPFLIGTKTDVSVPTSGRLFLRVNATDDLAASGEFNVKIKFSSIAAAAISPGVTDARVTEVSGQLSPETFADIPRRVADTAGHDGDMVNFALLGTQAQVEASFKAGGWVAVDKSVQDAVLHGLLSTLNHEAYTEMPMSTLFLFGRAQDLSYARGDPLKVAAERHHLRLWETDKTVGGVPLWVGSATHDVGFEKDQRNGNVTHKIDPKIDLERDFLLQSFDASGVFSSAAYVTPADPLVQARTATGGTFYSDGRILVMALK